MGTRKKFSAAEQELLRANPYTEKVTENQISFTLAFKEAFWRLSVEGCTGMALRKLGYDPELLGFERVHNITKRIRRAGKSPEGIQPAPKSQMRISREQFGAAELEKMFRRESERRMQQEIVYLQQQMAFLKKLMRQPEETDSDNAVQDAFFEVYKHNSEKTWKIHGVEESINFHRRVLDALKNRDVATCLNLQNETSLDKGTQRKTTENELPSLTQCTA